MFRKILISIFFAMLAIVPIFAADSATANPPELIGGTLLPGIESKDEIQKDAIGWLQNTFLKNLIDNAIGWTAALAVLFLIIGGYQYLTAVGDEEQIKSAHKTIIFALVGLFFALLAFAIVQIVVNIQFSGEGGGAGKNTNDVQYNESDIVEDDDEIQYDGSDGTAPEDEYLDDLYEDALSYNSSNLFAADVKDVLPFAEEGWKEVEEIKNLPKGDFKEEFLPIVARFLIYGMAFAAFLIFFFAGAWLVVGWGEEADVKKAKDAIIWAITGLAIASASYILVKGLLGIDLSW